MKRILVISTVPKMVWRQHGLLSVGNRGFFPKDKMVCEAESHFETRLPVPWLYIDKHVPGVVASSHSFAQEIAVDLHSWRRTP